MAPPPTSPPASPPSELREISPRSPLQRPWRCPIVLEMMMGEGFQRILVQEAELIFRRVVCQELENGLNNYIIPIPRQLVGGAQHARYHLKFQNKICHLLHTFRKIEGEGGSDVQIALFDNDKKVIVTSGPLSSIKVEIVVLNGDFNNDDQETWSEDEFNRRIALPRDNKGQLLKGGRPIKLSNGIGSLGNIAFTDNSSSRKTKTFRLGVRYAQSAPNGERIQEGITEPFRVKDRRVESSQKHHTPSLDDEVWRLKYIARDGKFHKRLQGHGIETVQDFLRCYNLEKGKLRNDSVESWKNLAYREINGMQFDHRMINGHPVPLLSSDVTSLPGSSSLPLQIRNSDQVDSASRASRDLFIGETSIDLDNHQTKEYTSSAETNDASLERDNSLDFTPPLEEIAPIQPENYDEQATQVGFHNQAESPPFTDPLRIHPIFSRMSSFDMSFFDGPITFSRMSSFDTNFFDGLIPDSSGGETSHGIAPPSPHPRWLKLLAPIKWVHFTKKRRARISIHQTLVATVN